MTLWQVGSFHLPFLVTDMIMQQKIDHEALMPYSNILLSTMSCHTLLAHILEASSEIFRLT